MIRTLSQTCLCLLSLGLIAASAPLRGPDGDRRLLASPGFRVVVGSCDGNKEDPKKKNVNKCSNKSEEFNGTNCQTKDGKEIDLGAFGLKFKFPFTPPNGCEGEKKDQKYESNCKAQDDHVFSKEKGTDGPDPQVCGPLNKGDCTTKAQQLAEYITDHPDDSWVKKLLKKVELNTLKGINVFVTDCVRADPSTKGYCPNGAETEEAAVHYNKVKRVCGGR